MRSNEPQDPFLPIVGPGSPWIGDSQAGDLAMADFGYAPHQFGRGR